MLILTPIVTAVGGILVLVGQWFDENDRKWPKKVVFFGGLLVIFIACVDGVSIAHTQRKIQTRIDELGKWAERFNAMRLPAILHRLTLKPMGFPFRLARCVALALIVGQAAEISW
jgi:hypothetical protein